MASGSFNVSTANQYISGYVSWSSSTDTAGNYSTVRATLYLSRNNTGYTTSGTGTFYISIDGNQNSNTQSFSLTYNSNTQMVTHTATVNHNSDGTRAIYISAWGSMPGTSCSMSSQGSTVTLDTIPRASTPTLSASSADMGTAITIYTNRASTSFTHYLSYGFGSERRNIPPEGNAVNDSVSWTIPLSLANQIPNSTSGTGTIYCDTYNGGTLIGTKSVNFTATIPSSVVPTFTGISHSELTSSVGSIGKYVQKLSNIRISISGATGSYGSNISSYTINYNGANYYSSSIDTGVISWSGNMTVTATIADSRGRIASSSITLSALPYNPPNVTAFVIERCNSDHSANQMGETAKITVSASVSSLYNNGEKNSLTYTLYAKLRTTGTWTTIKSASTISGLSLSNNIDYISTFTATSSYDFRVDVTDKFNTTISLNVLPTGQVTMSWGKSGIGIGKIWESGALDVAGTTNILGDLNIKKSGTDSYIRFDAQTNDPGYIRHYENNNASAMYFSVSDDFSTQDYFSFGASPGGTYQEGTWIYSNGNMGTNGTFTSKSRIYQNNNQTVWGSGDLILGGNGLPLYTTDINSTSNSIAFYDGSSMTGAPTSEWYYVLQMVHSGNASRWKSQLAIDFYSDNFYLRRGSDSGYLAWQNWRRIILDGDTHTVGNLYIGDSNTILGKSSYNALNIATPYGSITIGPQNTSYAHFNTDRPQYYFDRDVVINGNIIHYTTTAGMGYGNEIWSKAGSLLYVNYRGGSGLQVCNGTYNTNSSAYGPIYSSSKSAVVGTENYGEVITYCDESPNHVFHDSGSGILDENGECYVFIDPILLETINTNMSDYQVYLTGYKGANAEISEKYSDYFIVCGIPNKEFDWLIRAERKGFERLRFNEADIAV